MLTGKERLTSIHQSKSLTSRIDRGIEAGIMDAVYDHISSSVWSDLDGACGSRLDQAMFDLLQDLELAMIHSCQEEAERDVEPPDLEQVQSLATSLVSPLNTDAAMYNLEKYLPLVTFQFYTETVNV